MKHETARQAPPGGARILVVDDEIQKMKALCEMLREQGFAPFGHTSGIKALEGLRPGQYDLLLTDLVMPGMDGKEMLKAALEKDPELFGILMIEQDNSGAAAAVTKAGAMDCLWKPVNLANLLAALARAALVKKLRVENEGLRERGRLGVEQCEAAKKELEEFLYSVSHDLRAPLRAVNGFSEILQQDHAKFLTGEGREIVGRVRANAQRMSEMLEDLIFLSKVARQPMHHRAVDMGRLAREALAELEKDRKGAAVRVKWEALPGCRGDASLLRQVWSNLLSNALKFTRRQPEPQVEIGGERDGMALVYFVKDNGAGFNPEYAERLFGVFQRLHHADEFEGRGIGLPIVKRIAQRHGGKAWAKGEVEKGATFYFSVAAEERAPGN